MTRYCIHILLAYLYLGLFWEEGRGRVIWQQLSSLRHRQPPVFPGAMQSLREAQRLTCRLLCLNQHKCRALSPWTNLCGFAFEKNIVGANKEKINHCIWVISSSSEEQVDFPLHLVWTWVLSYWGMPHCPLDIVNEMDRAPSKWQISPWSREMELKSCSSCLCWTL